MYTLDYYQIEERIRRETINICAIAKEVPRGKCIAVNVFIIKDVRWKVKTIKYVIILRSLEKVQEIKPKGKKGNRNK